MKNDLLLVIGVLVFIFILWVYTGGPSRPISFAGPYLTPITTSGDVSEGYYADDAERSFWGAFREGWTSIGPGSGSAEPGADFVPGDLSLSGGNTSAEDPDEEYLVIRNTGNANVSVSGWRLASERSGAGAAIPLGERIARTTGRTGIVLGPGEEAIVVTGESPIRTSFLETRCTGYLDSSDRFVPSLSTGCPAPLDELDAYYRGSATSYDRCAAYVGSLPSCREARSVPRSIPAACEAFVDDRLSYRGCVAAHRNHPAFFSGTWRVYLGEGRQLWRSGGESIVLIDASGNVVDRLAY